MSKDHLCTVYSGSENAILDLWVSHFPALSAIQHWNPLGWSLFSFTLKLFILFGHCVSRVSESWCKYNYGHNSKQAFPRLFHSLISKGGSLREPKKIGEENLFLPTIASCLQKRFQMIRSASGMCITLATNHVSRKSDGHTENKTKQKNTITRLASHCLHLSMYVLLKQAPADILRWAEQINLPLSEILLSYKDLERPLTSKLTQSEP